MPLHSAQVHEQHTEGSDESPFGLFLPVEDASSPELLSFEIARLQRDLDTGNALTAIYTRLESGNTYNYFKPLSVDDASLREKKDLCRFGGNPLCEEALTHAFEFQVRIPGLEQKTELAENSGLEGFIFKEKILREQYGTEPLLHHVQNGHYFDYLSHIFEQQSFDPYIVAALREFRNLDLSAEEKYSQLVDFLDSYIVDLREVIAPFDQARWAKYANIYYLYPRTFNLEGLRSVQGREQPSSEKFFAALDEEDLLYIRDHLCMDSIWFEGLSPIGERNRKGDAGGSPYSIRDPLAINPDFGTEQDFTRVVNLMHKLGMKVQGGFVPNHTAMDSVLLEDNTQFYVHKAADPNEEVPDGAFEYVGKDGARYFIAHGAFDANGAHNYFTDTAQLDYSNPQTRELMIQIAETMIDRWGLDGFRVDMSYCVTEEYFNRTWNERFRAENNWPVPEDTSEVEFLYDFHSRLKARRPWFATWHEAYDKWNTLSMAGANGIYGKNDIARKRGALHQGYFDTLVLRSPDKMRGMLRRVEFLYWQCGGPTALLFDGNHDEPALKRKMGETYWKGVATFTALLPGGRLLMAGQEIGVDQADKAVEGDLKPLPFSKKSKIDWTNPDPEHKILYEKLNGLRRQYTLRRSNVTFTALRDMLFEDTEWVGYEVSTNAPKNKGYIVLLNPTYETTGFDFKREVDDVYSGALSAGGYLVLDIESGKVLLSDTYSTVLFSNKSAERSKEELPALPARKICS